MIKSKRLNKKRKCFYWPLTKKEWKIIHSNSEQEFPQQKLSDWEEMSFTWNIPTGLNDWAAYSLSYLSCLDLLEISGLESIEILRLIWPLKEIEFESPKSYKADAWKYLEPLIKGVQASQEALIDAYVKSRYLKWSRSSVESLYKIPISLLNQ